MPANRIAAWLAAALSCTTLPVRADQPLGNDALRAEVVGSTVHIDAPLGYKIPMQFREDGSVHGTAGGLAFYLGSSVDQGRWWIANSKLCTRWKQWFDQEDNCIAIRRQGRDEFHWVNDKGKSGTGRVVERRPVAVASAGGAAGRPSEVPSQFKAAAVQPPQSVTASPPKPALPMPAKRPADQAVSRAALGGPASKEKAAAGAGETLRANEPKPARAKIAEPPAKQSRTTSSAAAAEPNAWRTTTRPEPQKVFRVVNVDDDDELFVRAQPNPGAPIVTSIPPDGRGVHALGPCQNSWCPVSFDGRTGWAHGAYLVAEGK